jgi:hypothetical protein
MHARPAASESGPGAKAVAIDDRAMPMKNTAIIFSPPQRSPSQPDTGVASAKAAKAGVPSASASA